MSAKILPVIFTVLCVSGAAVAEPSIDEIRRQCVAQARAHLKAPPLDVFKLGSGDEHIMRNMHRAYQESLVRTKIALVWAGDEQAMREVEESVPWARRLTEAWAEEQHFAHGRLSYSFGDLCSALSIRRPQLALEFRQRAEPMHKADASIRRSQKTVEQMTLHEIAAAVKRPSATQFHATAMKRWLLLEPDEAVSVLEAILLDKSHEINYRCHAAGALARVTGMKHDKARRAALAWLESGCVDNIGLGAVPAVYLLRAGKEGRGRFFDLLQEYDSVENPPYVLRCGIESCSEAEYFADMEQFLELENPKFKQAARSRLGRVKINEEVMSQILRYFREDRFEPDRLFVWVHQSLTQSPPTDRRTRALVSSWVDLLQEPKFAKHWRSVAELHLTGGWGTPEVLAATAREKLNEPLNRRLACEILSRHGNEKDIAALWEVARDTESVKGAHISMAHIYAQDFFIKSEARLAILRLTAHLPPIEVVHDEQIPARALEHIGLLNDAREEAIQRYMKEDSWIGLTKSQLEKVLRAHGFQPSYRYGEVYEDYFGTDYDEAILFPLSKDDLWIVLKGGKVAKVATIYRE